MKQWTQQRIEWIDRQFLAAPSLSLKAGAVDPGARLDLRAPRGRVYYTLSGTDPRAPGGAVAPGAQLYRSAIVLNENAAVYCRAYQDNRWSPPTVERFLVSPPSGGLGK